jgi:hypothetical protein
LLGPRPLDGGPRTLGHIADEGVFFGSPLARLRAIDEQDCDQPALFQHRHVDEGARAAALQCAGGGGSPLVGAHVGESAVEVRINDKEVDTITAIVNPQEAP